MEDVTGSVVAVAVAVNVAVTVVMNTEIVEIVDNAQSSDQYNRIDCAGIGQPLLIEAAPVGNGASIGKQNGLNGCEKRSHSGSTNQ